MSSRKILTLCLLFNFILVNHLFAINNSSNHLLSRDCENLSQDECTENPECEWSAVITPNGFFEICIEIGVMDDGGWNDDGGSQSECDGLSYENCEYLDFCEWISDSDNLNSMGFCIQTGGPNPCSDFNHEDCEWYDECVWTDQGCQDYDWNNDCDPDMICGQALTCYDDFYYPTTCGPENCDEPLYPCNDGDDGGLNDCDPDLICGEAITCIDGLLYPTICGPENCDQPIGECDSNNGDIILECLQDCPGVNDINAQENPNEACDWIVSTLGIVDPGFASCFSNCDDEIYEIIEACFECLQNENIECSEVFNNEDDDSDCDFLTHDECVDSGNCEPLLDFFGDFLVCVEIAGINPCSDFNEENCNWYDECIWTEEGCQDYNWNQECDPNLICATVLTCVGELLYPTACGPDNCDEPIGVCEHVPDCLDGEVNNDNPCNPMECYDGQWVEIIIDCAEQMGVPCEGGIYVAPPEGVCCSTCVEYGDTVLRLGHVVGYPGDEVVVPLFLDSESASVGGVQFTITAFGLDGLIDYVVPLGIISTDECFTANFNNLDGSFIGIIFSFEGCEYSSEDNIHIANLVYELLDNSDIGNNAELVFENTIISDSAGNEVPSHGISGSIYIGMLGDINGDGNINVIDVVLAVSFAISTDEPSDSEYWASDINQDGMINVLDIVQLVSIILESDNNH